MKTKLSLFNHILNLAKQEVVFCLLYRAPSDKPNSVLPACFLLNPTNIFQLRGLGLPVGSGDIVVAGVAAYSCPVVYWQATGLHEEDWHREGQPSLSSQ